MRKGRLQHFLSNLLKLLVKKKQRSGELFELLRNAARDQGRGCLQRQVRFDFFERFFANAFDIDQIIQ